MSAVLLDAVELRRATEWAERHRDEVEHAGNPIFRIVERDKCGIGTTYSIVCEDCNRERVSDANHHDITDYDAW